MQKTEIFECLFLKIVFFARKKIKKKIKNLLENLDF